MVLDDPMQTTRWPVLITALFTFILPGSGLCQNGGLVVKTAGGKVSLTAEEVPLRTILARLAGEEQMTVYLAEKVQDRPITIKLDGLPLEKVIAKLLADYSYLASFKEADGRQRITMLKVYPKGSFRGRLERLRPFPAATAEGGAVPLATSRPLPPPTQLAAPEPVAELTPTASPGGKTEQQEDPVTAAMRQDFAREQQKLFEEQLVIERRLAAATDPEERQALAMALAAQVEKLEELKKTQINKLESFKRLRSLAESAQATR